MSRSIGSRTRQSPRRVFTGTPRGLRRAASLTSGACRSPSPSALSPMRFTRRRRAGPRRPIRSSFTTIGPTKADTSPLGSSQRPSRSNFARPSAPCGPSGTRRLSTMSFVNRHAPLPRICLDVRSHRRRAGFGAFFALTKPRVMSLTVFTALVGLLLAPHHKDPLKDLFALLCIAMGAGSAAALNMWFDADIDAVMARTARRPIPSGLVSRTQALAFGLVLAAVSVAGMALLVNSAAAATLAFTIYFYVVVYTMWLKR